MDIVHDKAVVEVQVWDCLVVILDNITTGPPWKPRLSLGNKFIKIV